MIKSLVTLVLIVFSIAFVAAAEGPAKPLLYFDLGNSVVDTKTYDFAKIVYMPGAYDYVSQLKAAGFDLGLIVNIPESWGATRDEKLAALKTFVDSRWAKDEKPMLWGAFDLGILIPLHDSERKPAPLLFQEAKSYADEACRFAIYLGEDKDEVDAAIKVGLKGYQLGSEPAAFYPSIDALLNLASGNPCH